MGMGGLALQNLLKPAEVFSGAYPMGYDRITDGLSIFPGTSPRLEYLMRQTVGCTFTLAYFFSPTSPSAFL
jgi:hypothetical protein